MSCMVVSNYYFRRLPREPLPTLVHELPPDLCKLLSRLPLECELLPCLQLCWYLPILTPIVLWENSFEGRESLFRLMQYISSFSWVFGTSVPSMSPPSKSEYSGVELSARHSLSLLFFFAQNVVGANIHHVMQNIVPLHLKILVSIGWTILLFYILIKNIFIIMLIL